MFENEELDSIVMRMRTFAEQSNFMDDRKYLLFIVPEGTVCVSTSHCHGKFKADHIYNFVHDFQLVYNSLSSSDEFLKAKTITSTPSQRHVCPR